MMRSFFRATAVLIMLLSVELRAQTVFRGEQILKSSEQTVNIFESFLGILSTQAAHNDAPSYFGVNFRNAPGEFVLDDNTREPGGLTRIQLSFGSATGDRLSEGSLFFGLTADNVTTVEKGELTKGPSKFSQSTSFQAILYAGYGVGEVQLAYGYIDKGSLNGLNLQNQFTRSSPQKKGTELSSGHMVTLYHSAGAVFSVSSSEALTYDRSLQEWKTPESVLEMRFHLQPLKRFLPEAFGLPFLSVDRLSRLKNYYGQYLPELAAAADQAEQYYEQYGIPAVQILTKDPYEVTLGSDNMRWLSFLRELRFRAAMTAQVYPSFKFRGSEIAGHWRFSKYVSAGLRGELYYGLDWNSSFDAFLLFGVYGAFQYGLSYSFNSPDGTTFLPIRGAHVVGLQVVFGLPEMVKPLIPIVRGLDEIDDDHYSRNDD